jgi:hypothetical protein
MPFSPSKTKTMDSIERRLIELRQALLKQAVDQAMPAQALIQQAYQSLSGVTIDTGPGNDVVIINSEKSDCNKPPGPPGPPGSRGPRGPRGKPGTARRCATLLISEDYATQPEDYYIGVTSEGPVQVVLTKPEQCQEIVVKAEMGPPLGNRKITVVGGDGSLIDGKISYIIEVPYDFVRVIYREPNWHIV